MAQIFVAFSEKLNFNWPFFGSDALSQQPEGGFGTPHLTKCVSQMQYNGNEYEFANWTLQIMQNLKEKNPCIH